MSFLTVLVLAEIGMVMLAIWGPWALKAGCDVANRGEPLWVAMVLADPNPVMVVPWRTKRCFDVRRVDGWGPL